MQFYPGPVIISFKNFKIKICLKHQIKVSYFLKYITACNYKLNKLLFKLYVND